MRNVALVIEYDGSLFHGWQSQKNAHAIQDAVIAAVSCLDGAPRRVVGASRTDAGVHARGQVAHFWTDSNIPADKYAYALNTVLPAGITCVSSSEAATDFHARFSVKSKVYSYLILNRRFPSALYRNYAWHVPLPLDVQKMREAAQLFVGVHDFRAFMSTGSPVESTVRGISRLEISVDQTGAPHPVPAPKPATAPQPTPAPQPAPLLHPAPVLQPTHTPLPHDTPGSFITFTIEGKSFLYNMVRIITGTLVYVGQGRLGLDGVKQALSSGRRESAGKTAPPQGLCLEYIKY